MITNSKEKHFPAAKQEGPSDERLHKAPTSTSRQWSSAGFRNPRIVRVSRTFGGKDRHSKVCTVRGLRDRRIRLSVPTAVQLYYLQDRLGLSQPSKVIDWLIDATKQDIDKLPPLQIPQGVFGQFLHHHHHDHDHQHLNLLPQLDHHQAKTNEQDQFAQKLFGNMSSSYMNCYQNSDHTSFLGHGIALPQIDGSHTNLAVMSNCSTSLFNSPSLQSQLFFRAPPPPSNISTTSSIFGPPYPPYITTIHHENPHDPIRSQIINSHVQLLSASNTSASTSANTSASSSSSHQYQHVLHHSLMSSLHSTSTATSASANINHNPPLIKSFPALFNPRLLAQSSSTVYENRLEKDRTAG